MRRVIELIASRVYQMPARWVQMQEVVAALVCRFGADREGVVQYVPDTAIQKLFASYPPLKTPAADALGVRHDGDASSLVNVVFT